MSSRFVVFGMFYVASSAAQGLTALKQLKELICAWLVPFCHKNVILIVTNGAKTAA